MAGKDGGFSDFEKQAMKERAAELRAEAKAAKGAAKAKADLDALLERIAEMPEPDRSLATRIHELVLGAAPDLYSKTMYGMPAYTLDGKTVCFFQSAQKFGTRYCCLGFEDRAMLDDGTMWPVGYAITQIGDAEERLITDLVRKAVG